MDPLDLEKVVPEVTCHCIRIVFVSKTLDRPAEKRRDPASGRVLEFRVIENIEEFGAERQLELRLSFIEAKRNCQSRNSDCRSGRERSGSGTV
jgi:hypothetical protein